MKFLHWGLGAVLATAAMGAAADFSVLAISNPWLAGAPSGTDAGSGDSAPGQSPLQVSGVAIVPGATLRFSAVGSTDHCTGGACGLAGPDGDAAEGLTAHIEGTNGAQFGIANIVAPIDSLIGVFLDDTPLASRPAAPAPLDFSVLGLDFSVLSAELQQPFFIGDGLRSDGVTLQEFIVPAGATRLFLGTMDGFGWFNNVGSLRVSVVPEPATLGLVLGAGALLWARRRPRRRT